MRFVYALLTTNVDARTSFTLHKHCTSNILAGGCRSVGLGDG
jgi:hypothetical protein